LQIVSNFENVANEDCPSFSGKPKKLDLSSIKRMKFIGLIYKRAVAKWIIDTRYKDKTDIVINIWYKILQQPYYRL